MIPVPQISNGASPRYGSIPVLRFLEATKQYRMAERAVNALTGISLQIAAGEFVALVGRSGSGKSSFLNLAGAADTPSSGDVQLDGLSTSGLSDEELTRIRREHVGFVFQFFHLFPTLSAVENVEVPLQLAGHKGSRPRALDVLEMVGLAGFSDRYPHQLSGGEMQRVAIARALGPRPKLLLADEPMGNLDSQTAAEVMRLFQRINAELRTTIVMATHNLESAKECDRLLTLKDGRLVSDVQTP